MISLLQRSRDKGLKPVVMEGTSLVYSESEEQKKSEFVVLLGVFGEHASLDSKENCT